MSAKLRSDIILVLAAVIWGFAFVAQRVGMEYVGPFTFNGVRFSLGTLVLLPFILFKTRFSQQQPSIKVNSLKKFTGVILTGLLLFTGVALQQIGLKTTSAGKAGFITGLYVVFVPIVGIFFKHRTTLNTWLGVIFSATGLYLLTVKSGLRIEHGDLLIFLCAIVFTFHVLMIGWLSPKMNPFHLAIVQFAICAILNIIIAVVIEPIYLLNIANASIPILYGGIFSVGIAYTLQVIAQKNAHPAYASIILSMEAVFATLGGCIILHEQFTSKSFIGCILMLTGMVIVQLKSP